MTNPFAYPQPTAPAAPQPAPAPPPAAPAANPFGTPGQPVALTNPTGGPTVPVPMNTAPGTDPFSAPAPQQPRGPRLRDIYGRLLLVIPHKLEEGLVSRTFRNPDGSAVVNDRMTADIIVLDGGPIHYGGKPEAVPPMPHDKVANPPHRTPRAFISAVGLISQCREALAKRQRGEPGMVLGRLGKGESNGKGEPPWLLAPFTPEDAQIARQYLSTVDPFA